MQARSTWTQTSSYTRSRRSNPIRPSSSHCGERRVRARFQLVTSELTWLEALAKPLRDGDAPLEAMFRAFLTATEMNLVPATLAIWEHAARLRGFGLKTPDALHAGTGLSAGCALFLTNDLIFGRVPALPVTIWSVAITS
jgi:hypothetical protein